MLMAKVVGRIALGTVVSVSALAVMAGSASAYSSIKPRVAGIGFAKLKFVARIKSIRAWKRAARNRYGSRYAHFSTARNKRTRCSYIGYRRFHNRNRTAISGNPNAPWTCVTKANPALKIVRPPVAPRPVNVTGIGYGSNEAAATGRAIRAWTNTARRRYGRSAANFNSARHTSLRCVRIGRGFSTRRSRRIIGVDGNPNAPWTCTAKGRPRLARRYSAL